ncbi:MAG: rhodanese-like domain-containing protein [Steroidobacteraceae bacterium]
MYQRIAVFFALSLLSSVAPAQQATPARNQTSQAHLLTRAEFDQLLATPDKVVLIDVRRPDEIISVGGFPVYLSIQLKELENSLQWIPKDRQIVTVSNHAGRAGKAADLLAAKGLRVAGAIGAQTYEQEGGTLTKIAAPAPKSAAAGNGSN